MYVVKVPPHVARPRRVIAGVGRTSRRLLDLQPDTPYFVSLAARTVAGLGPVVTVEDRTLKMSSTSKTLFYNNHNRRGLYNDDHSSVSVKN